jgi:hypothetical protein
MGVLALGWAGCGGGSDSTRLTTVRVAKQSGAKKASPVPDLINKRESHAEAIVRNAGFRLSVKAVPLRGLRGVVLGQDPLGGTSLRQGGTVTIKVGSLSSAAANCNGNLAWGGSPGAAGGIQVEGVDCASAKALIDDAHATEPCRKGDRCQVDGYSCSQDVAATQALTVTCVSGSRKVGWTWGS